MPRSVVHRPALSNAPEMPGRLPHWHALHFHRNQGAGLRQGGEGWCIPVGPGVTHRHHGGHVHRAALALSSRHFSTPVPLLLPGHPPLLPPGTLQPFTRRVPCGVGLHRPRPRSCEPLELGRLTLQEEGDVAPPARGSPGHCPRCISGYYALAWGVASLWSPSAGILLVCLLSCTRYTRLRARSAAVNLPPSAKDPDVRFGSHRTGRSLRSFLSVYEEHFPLS